MRAYMYMYGYHMCIYNTYICIFMCILATPPVSWQQLLCYFCGVATRLPTRDRRTFYDFPSMQLTSILFHFCYSPFPVAELVLAMLKNLLPAAPPEHGAKGEVRTGRDRSPTHERRARPLRAAHRPTQSRAQTTHEGPRHR